jgi:hypothetical protein
MLVLNHKSLLDLPIQKMIDSYPSSNTDAESSSSPSYKGSASVGFLSRNEEDLPDFCN